MLLANHQGTAIKWMVESAMVFYKSEYCYYMHPSPSKNGSRDLYVIFPKSNLNADLNFRNRV